MLIRDGVQKKLGAYSNNYGNLIVVNPDHINKNNLLLFSREWVSAAKSCKAQLKVAMDL